MESISMRCTKEQYESIKEFIGELERPSPDDFIKYNFLTNGYTGGKKGFMVKEGLTSGKIHLSFNKDVFLKACGIYPEVKSTKSNLADVEKNMFDKGMLLPGGQKPLTNEALNGIRAAIYKRLEDAIWEVKAPALTKEELETLNPPRFKVGGIYQWNDEGTKILMKVTGDDNKEIFGYGFVDGNFSKKVQKWYTKGYYDEAVKELQETTVEKWEKALLKYKK